MARSQALSRSRGVTSGRGWHPLWRFIGTLCLVALLLPRSAPVRAGEGAEQGQPIGAFNLLAPIENQVSGAVWAAMRGYDPRFTAVPTEPGSSLAGRLAPAPGAPVQRGAAAPLVPVRNTGPAFSRNQIITRQAGLVPIQTEPSIAVDPTDPQHLVMGTIDYNFPGIVIYVSFDAGETWQGPNPIRFFQEDLAGAGDPVLAFDRNGTLFATMISVGLQEFQIGSIASELEVSSMIVASSTDGGLTWSNPVPAARSTVTTKSNPGTDGKDRGTITSAFLDKPWLTVGPDRTNPGQDMLYLTYTEFATTYSLIYADEVPFLTSPYTETTIRVVTSRDGGLTWSTPTGVSPTVLEGAGASKPGEGGAGESAPGTSTAAGQPAVPAIGGESGVGAASADGAAAAPRAALQGVAALRALQQPLTQQQAAAGIEANRTVQGSQPKVMSDGTAVIAYLDTTNDGIQQGLAAIMVTLSTDGGKTWSEPAQAAVFQEPHYTNRTTAFRWWGTAFPQLAVGPKGEIYIATTFKPTDKPADDGDVYLLRSLDKGKTWQPPVRLNGDNTDRPQFFPAIAVSPDGVVHAMWGDMRDDPQMVRYNIYYSESKDQGKTWGFENPSLGLKVADTRASDFASDSLKGFPDGQFIGDYFSIAATNDDAYLVWADTRLGEFNGPQQQVGFARKTAIRAPSLFLNPPSGSAGRQVTVQGLGFAPQSNVVITLGDATISSARTGDKGEFTVNLFIPVTGQGASNLAAYDETGNVAIASFYTAYGFDSVQQQIAALQQQIAALTGTPVAAATPVAGVASPIAVPARPASPVATTSPGATPVSAARVGDTVPGAMLGDVRGRLPTPGGLAGYLLAVMAGAGLAWQWRRRRA